MPNQTSESQHLYVKTNPHLFLNLSIVDNNNNTQTTSNSNSVEWCLIPKGNFYTLLAKHCLYRMSSQHSIN